MPQAAAKRRTKPKRKAPARTEPRGIDRAMKLLDTASIMKEVEEKFNLAGASVNEDVRQSTVVPSGVLTLDLIYNGGFYPGGWYTKFGFEQCGKSTALLHALASLLNQGLPLNVYMEPEGSSTHAYVQAVAGHMLHSLARYDRSLVDEDGKLDIVTVFGKKDKNGKWIVVPRVWHYRENILQSIWKSLFASLRRLPDKKHIDDEWWLLFPRTRQNQAKYGKQADKAMSAKQKAIAVKSPDGGTAQALLMVDSLANMIPEEEDDDDGNNAVGLEARGHARHAKKVKGLLKRKHAILVAVNQLRESIPMRGRPAGPREPGGNAIKGYSDVRLQMTAMKHKDANYMSTAPYLNKEPSAEGKGSDMYRFLRVKTIKNKYGTPQIEEWIRLWERDRKGDCRGFDPVWDTWNYLVGTDQIRVTAPRGGKPMVDWEKAWHEVVMVPADPKAADGELFSLPRMKWPDFKKLVLLRGNALREHCKKLGIKQNPRLRERCAAQIKSGQGLALYHEARAVD